MLRVMGVDPGLQITGYGVVDLPDGGVEPVLVEAGVIRLAAKRSLDHRLEQLNHELLGIIDELKPHQLVVEKLYAHYKHPRTAILMAHARGVILLCSRLRGLPVDDLPSTAVKKAIAGYGHASKLQMQRAVQSQCSLRELPSPPDVADAIAIAITYTRRVAVDRL